MKIQTWFMSLLALLSVTAFADAGDDSWKLEKDKQGIQVYSRAVDGWDIREIKGVIHIGARLSSVVAVLVDVDASHQLSGVVSEAKVLSRDSDTRYRLYSAMKMPWPVSDRDIVNQRQITQDPATLAVTIVDDAVADEANPPRHGFVRLAKSQQRWIVTPAGNGEVIVEMRALTDPAGPIPSGIVNFMAVDSPFETLGHLKQLAQSQKYANTSLPFIKEPGG
jgi:hypothetical protein